MQTHYILDAKIKGNTVQFAIWKNDFTVMINHYILTLASLQTEGKEHFSTKRFNMRTEIGNRIHQMEY